MADLSTRYLGLTLTNPIIVASSRLTSTLEGVKRCEDAGAGAVVLKSLFEEQITADASKMLEGADMYAHADAFDFFDNSSKEYFIDTYLDLVEKAKKSVQVPIIASLNCVSPGKWLENAHRFEEAGADALEINSYIIPSQAGRDGQEIEHQYDKLIREIRKHVSIPIALKMGENFSGLANRMRRFEDLGVDGLVLFNRFYRTDINIEDESVTAGKVLSSPEEYAQSLRWIGLMSGELKLDFCANTGIYDGETIIKQLLAGASSVGICSALMKHGHDVIGTMKGTIEAWMERKEYASIADFKGKLCQESSDDPDIWERSQYIKAVCGIS